MLIRGGFAAALALCFAPFASTLAKDAGALGDPIALAAADVLREPAPAVRADRWDGRLITPGNPVSVPLLCLADTAGRVIDCLAVSGPVPRFRSALDFMRAAGTDNLATRDPSLTELARARARQRILRPRPGNSHFLFSVTETIGHADPQPVAASGDPVFAMGDLYYERMPGAAVIERLFPAIALRRAEGTRMLATCRIMADHSLFCRDARQDPAMPPLTDPVRREFALATYQVASEIRVKREARDGNVAVGRDVTIAVSWFVG